MKDKDKYEKMKGNYNLKGENQKSHEIMRLSSTCQRHWLQWKKNEKRKKYKNKKIKNKTWKIKEIKKEK